jgi:hypothetical protein
MARHDECEWNCGGTDCPVPTRYVPSEDAEKEVLEKSGKRKRSLVQRFVMWWKLPRKAKHLIRNGWTVQAGGYASPRKDDFRLYTLPEALKEEAFYWATT